VSSGKRLGLLRLRYRGRQPLSRTSLCRYTCLNCFRCLLWENNSSAARRAWPRSRWASGLAACPARGRLSNLYDFIVPRYIHPTSNTASVRYSARRRPSGKVTSHWIKRFTRELCTQARIVVAAEPLAQILSGNSVREIAAQQTLYRIGHLRSYAPIAQRPSRASILSHCSANAEIECIDELAVVLYLFPFDTNVGDPMLSAANSGMRSSISSTSHRVNVLVSVTASLQNSVPVQEIAPRQKELPSTCRSILFSS
jgi:hypothetical protein